MLKAFNKIVNKNVMEGKVSLRYSIGQAYLQRWVNVW